MRIWETFASRCPECTKIQQQETDVQSKFTSLQGHTPCWLQWAASFILLGYTHKNVSTCWWLLRGQVVVHKLNKIMKTMTERAKMLNLASKRITNADVRKYLCQQLVKIILLLQRMSPQLLQWISCSKKQAEVCNINTSLHKWTQNSQNLFIGSWCQ